MSKSMIGAFAKAQLNLLLAKDNKEKLRYCIAGCKDEHLYSHSGTNYGKVEGAEDTVFIPESDLELSRITGAKLATIARKMDKFFGFDVEDVVEDVVEESEDVVACRKAIKKGKVKKAKKLLATIDDSSDVHAELTKLIKEL